MPKPTLLERLRAPVSMSMFVNKTDMIRELLEQRTEAADEIERLRSAVDYAIRQADRPAFANSWIIRKLADGSNA